MSSIASVRETLFSLQDPAYQAFQSKLCPGVDNIIGVRMPALRPLARKLARESGLLYFQEGPEDYYEELLLKAMVLGYADETVNRFFAKALFAVGEDWDMEQLLPIVMEIGEKIVYIHDGLKWWEGTKEEILHADNRELNDFVFASAMAKRATLAAR